MKSKPWSFLLSPALFLAAILLLSVSCQQKKPPAKNPELVILCGNSFIPPTEKLIADFKERTGISAVFTTGGSEDLLPHVKNRQKGDIFVTHDPYLDYTREAGVYMDHGYVGFVAPVLAVQKGNPKRIGSIGDLAREGVKVAMSDPRYSTCGEMVLELLEKKGISEAVRSNIGNRLTKGHPNLGNLLKTGTVDAVMMWNGVAQTFREHIDIVKTPYEYDTEIRVSVIGLDYTSQKKEVKQFLEFVKQEGAAVFAGYGYVK